MKRKYLFCSMDNNLRMVLRPENACTVIKGVDYDNQNHTP